MNEKFQARQSRKASCIIAAVSPLFFIGALMALSTLGRNGHGWYAAMFRILTIVFSVVMGIAGLVLPFYGLLNYFRPRVLLSAGHEALHLNLYGVTIPWTNIKSIEVKDVVHERTQKIKCLSIRVWDPSPYRDGSRKRLSIALKTYPGEPDELNFNATTLDPPAEACAEALRKFIVS